MRSCIRSWSLRQLRKKHPQNPIIINRNDSNVNPSRPRPGNNRKLKLCLWNVRSIGKDGKLLSILGDERARRLNVLVLTETRHSEKVCLKLDEGHTIYNSGPTGERRNIGGVGFLVCADAKPAPGCAIRGPIRASSHTAATLQWHMYLHLCRVCAYRGIPVLQQ